MSNESLLTGKLSPAQQTGQFGPVCHSTLFLLFVTSFFFTVSFSTVSWDQTLLLRRRVLKVKSTKSVNRDDDNTVCCVNTYNTDR